MKNLIFISFLLTSVFSFAQSNTTLSGSLTDLEADNLPLIYAKVLVKETGAETLSNEKGEFKFKDLQAGSYTLVYSFTGYETKETKIEVNSGVTTTVALSLAASTVSLEDLMAVFASTDIESAPANNK